MPQEGTRVAAPWRRGGGRNVSGERHAPRRLPLTTPFLLHDFMEEAFPASVFSQGQVLLFQVPRNLMTMGLGGVGVVETKTIQT